MTDKDYMELALKLAAKGIGKTNPNPLVGSVIVKNDRIIGQGFHEGYGLPHAERNALADCTESPKDATMYVTLEPCCHHGKQPPCTEAIINAGISRVVVAAVDANPLMSGKGIDNLRQNGITVETGVLETESRKLNEVFFHYIQNKIPYVIMKYAMTLDGKIASYTGDSKWVTKEKARQRVMEDRRKYSAIMVGIGTVLADNPELTCRIQEGRNPVRIVCDSKLRIPLDSKLVTTAKETPVIIAACNNNADKISLLEKAGCKIILTKPQNGSVDLKELMKLLGDMEIDSVILEGGGELNWSALQAGIVNKVQAYIAPKITGGSKAKTPVEGDGVKLMNNSYNLRNLNITKYGEDILVEGEVDYSVYRDN